MADEKKSVALGAVVPYVGENGNWFVGEDDTGTPATGPKGPQGEKGETGATGSQGPAGADGYTPVKGVDYWTEADKAEIVSAVLAEIPIGDEVEY